MASTFYATLFACAVLAVAILFHDNWMMALTTYKLFFIPVAPHASSPSRTDPNVDQNKNSVGYVAWTPDAPFAEYLRDGMNPIVLRNSVASGFKRLSISEFAASVAAVDGKVKGFYRKQDTPYFGPYYDENRPFHSIINSQQPYEKDVSLAAGEVAAVFQGAGPPYYHLSVDPGPELTGQFNITEMLSLYPQKSSVNMWLSMTAATTPCHFDGYHNMFVTRQ